jgi:hypothetical protein
MAGFWVVLVLFGVVGYGIALTRKGRVASAKLGSRRKEFFVQADIESAFRVISAMRGKFTADDRDPATKVVVLSSPVSFATWGFIFPVYLHAAGTMGTRIELGCYSKLFQLGPLVTKAHNDCEAAIQAALSIPAARVA